MDDIMVATSVFFTVIGHNKLSCAAVTPNKTKKTKA